MAKVSISIRSKVTRRKVKGMVGIEAAIVLIAFVIVAAALAFVALNMGLFTTQKSKDVIARGLEEASSALEVDGLIVGKTKNESGSKKLVGIAIPLKLTTGRTPTDTEKISVKIVTADNITVIPAQEITDIHALNKSNPFKLLAEDGQMIALIEYQGDGDALIEWGEKWVLVINLTKVWGEGLEPYEKITVEIRPPVGAPLTVTRTVPPDLSEDYVVLD